MRKTSWVLVQSLIWAPFAAGLQPVFDVPEAARQGETIRIVIRNAEGAFEAASAVLGERRVPLFAQNHGEYLGLMPVAVDEAPGKHSLEIQDARQKAVRSVPVEILDARFPRQNIRVTRRMSALIPLPGEMETIRELQKTVSAERHWTEPFLSPTPDCVNSVFGVLRFHNGKYTGNYHRGVDLRSPMGKPVRAVTSGVVRIARMFRLHGGTVGLDHGQGVSSIYIHLSKVAVREGESVRKGDVIGAVGATGFATGPHLHWGLYVNGLPVNPAQWIPGESRCL